jgi:uncharacterized protein (TIGR01777 family)
MPFKVLISGSSGFIGTSIAGFLEAKGFEVHRLVRKKEFNHPRSIFWNPTLKQADLADFEGFDAVIHLAGENIMKGLWTRKKRRRILDSRTLGTSFLVEILQKVKNAPKVFISASAVGYYGDSQKELTEKSPPGKGFLSTVCQAWESASWPLKQREIRTLQARLGIVLSPKGGFLKTILPFFRLGLGCILGKGDQRLSWIALEDLLAAFYHLLLHKELEGPINIVAPDSVSQKEFARKLGEALSRPCFLHLPRWLFPGDQAKELLFSSLDVKPSKLHSSEFYYSFPSLQSVLEKINP